MIAATAEKTTKMSEVTMTESKGSREGKDKHRPEKKQGLASKEMNSDKGKKTTSKKKAGGTRSLWGFNSQST